MTEAETFKLATEHHRAGDLTRAEELYQKILAENPSAASAIHYLGMIAHQRGQTDAGVNLIRRAIALNPTYAAAYTNLGNALNDSGQLDEAIAAYRQAVDLRPNLPEAQNNLGNALKENGQLDEAIAVYRRAIALSPNLAQAHYNLALALLTRGDYQEGWEEHEWRWKVEGFPSPARNFAQVQWDGSPLNGRAILLYAEQGFGDVIQFIRYLPLVARRGGKIIVECQAELERLFRTIQERFQIVVRGQPLPAFDVQCPMMSLPRVFATNLENIPAGAAYLFPDRERLEFWRQKLNLSVTGLNIALNWAGTPNFKADRTRSITLDRLARLSQVRGATYFSIQKGAAEGHADRPPAGLRLINLAPELHDFADTVAVMCLMDLVISTDTSVPHLAGALGRPVWTMLQFMPDWRWHVDRDDSPWYPTMRLFRQRSRGDWDGVVGRVVEALGKFRTR